MIRMQILELAVKIAILFMAGFVVPALRKWIETKTENEQMEKVREWVYSAVYAAEQMYNRARKIDPDGSQRKKYVYNFIMRICAAKGVKITKEELEALIEAAVITMDTLSDNLSDNGGEEDG